MKKIFILVIISLILPQFVGAQTIEQDFPDSWIGIRGGYNFSKIDSDLGANTVRRRSMHLGIFYQHYLSDNFALQPEVQYSSEGWIKEFDPGDKEAKLHFANVTLVGKFFFWKNLNLQAGIQPALLIDGTEEDASTNHLVAIDESLHRFNLGAVFGIGYDFGFGLRLGGRYVQGLIDINESYNAASKSNEIKTTTFQAYIGYGFSLSRSGERRLDER